MAVYACLITFADFSISSWDIDGTVKEHGWLMTNNMLAKICLNNRPKGYDKNQTLDFIEANEEATNDASVIMPKNLIVIMDESFSDLSVLGELETDAEVMPFLIRWKMEVELKRDFLGYMF